MSTFSFWDFMHEGGKGTWLALLLGLAALAAAIRYAVRPERRYLRFIAALWLTLLVSVVHATVIDMAAVFHYLEDPVRAPDGQVARMLIAGLKESTRPAVLGGIFLTLVPLLVAAGLYREDRPATSS
jgi:Na+/H+ antiporter NhaA